jgi:hypothetical protein
MTSEWCKETGLEACGDATKIPKSKKCGPMVPTAAAARHLLNASASDGDVATASLQWGLKGFVKGLVKADAASGGHVTQAVYMFDTEKNSWEAAVGYSLAMNGVKMSLMGPVASPCKANKPTELSGSFQLELSQVHLITEVSAEHWCDANATTRLEVIASVPTVDVMGSTLRLTDVSVTWRALSGGKPAGTPLAQLRQSGEIRGVASSDFGVSSHGTVLALAAEVSLTFLYNPVNGGVILLDPLVDLEVSVTVAGMMPAGESPMLDAVVGGKYAPMREWPAEVSGTGTIRLPGMGKNDAIVELQTNLRARLWGSHIAPSIRRGRVFEFAATLTSESRTGSIYGFVINKVSAVATFMSSPNVLAGLRGDDGDDAGRHTQTEGESVDEQSEGETIAEPLMKPGTMHAHIEAAYAALGAASAEEESTNATATATSSASFPALKFDLADTMGTVDIFADVVLSPEDITAALSPFPDGLDASARVVWRGQLTRPTGANTEWMLAKAELSVATGVSFKSQSLQLELNGEVGDTCTPEGPLWALNGTMAVPSLGLELLTSAAYKCDTRRLNVEIMLASMRVPFGRVVTSDARDVVVSLEALVVGFPGENITADDDDDDDNSKASSTLGRTLSAADAGNTAYTGQAETLWNVTARGVISVEKGEAGMPDLDCTASVEIIMSNHLESDKALTESESEDGVNVETTDANIVSIGVNVSIAYALDGVALAGSGQFSWPCLDSVKGDASVVFDTNRTGITATTITSSFAVPCTGKKTPPGTPFIEFLGSVNELRITDEIIIEFVYLRVIGAYTPDGASAWLITLSAMSASPSMGSGPQAAPGAMEPAGSLYWSVDIALDVRTPSPLDVEKVGKKNASTAYELTATASVSYVTSAVEISAEGPLRLGVCEPDVPRMFLDGNVTVTLPGGTTMPFYGNMSVECVDPEQESTTVGDGGVGPIEDLSTAEGNKPANPEHIRSTVINITASADVFEIVPDVLRVDYMHVNASIIIPSSNADEVPTQMQGVAHGKAMLIALLPGVEGIDLEDNMVDFNVSFSTDAEGDVTLDKFILQTDVEIKYWTNGAPEDGASAALLGTHGHRFGSNLGEQNVIPALGGGSDLPNIHARAYVALQYPCVLGQSQRMELSLAVNFGEFAIPDVPVRLVYHCEQEGSKLPVFTAKGIRDTPAFISKRISVEGFKVELYGFRINEVMEYHGLVDGRLSYQASSSNAQVMFIFNTLLGRHGLVYRISFVNAYIKAELTGKLSVTGECDRPVSSANASDSNTTGVASLGVNESMSDFTSEFDDWGNATENATSRDFISGDIQVTLPKMAEIRVKMHGWMECAVDDAEKPMVELRAWIAEIRVHVSKDFELIVKRVGFRLRGFRDPANPDFTLTKPGDFKKLAFRARIQGTISLKLSSGMPELGAGFSDDPETAATGAGALEVNPKP